MLMIMMTITYIEFVFSTLKSTARVNVNIMKLACITRLCPLIYACRPTSRLDACCNDLFLIAVDILILEMLSASVW